MCARPEGGAEAGPEAKPDAGSPARSGMAAELPSGLQRHMLIWLSDQGWREARAVAQPQHLPALLQWQRQDWPAVVRRQDLSAANDEASLGIPLPPDAHTGEKVRVSLRARAGNIRKAAPALALSAALPAPALPPAWREQLAALSRDAGALRMHIYGSLAMQTLTGLPYVGTASDIDLLFQPDSRSQFDAGMALLTHYAEILPLDGEIVFPAGDAVSWKEWRIASASASAKVLVKQLHTVRLSDTAALLATLGDA